MSAMSREKPSLGGLGNNSGAILVGDDIIRERARPTVPYKPLSLKNPPLSTQVGPGPFSYQKYVLCGRCRLLVQSLGILGAGIQKDAEVELACSLSELLGCAAQGCHLCSILITPLEGPCWRGDGIVKEVEKVHVEISPETSDSPQAASTLSGIEEAKDTIIHYDMHTEVDTGIGSGGRISWGDGAVVISCPSTSDESTAFTTSSTSLKGPSCPKSDYMGESTGSEDSFEIAQWWLKYCLQHHGSCSVPPSHSQDVPTRLVEISSVASIMSVRLCSPEQRQSSCPYLALSHCWGKSQVFKLTTANSSDLHVEIPWDALSKTFQDAIEITHRLGYKHLWIDSLCIQQDSREDWEREAVKMGAYYGNAICSIAALGSEGGSGGCFKNRNPLRMQDCVVHSDNNRSLHIRAAPPARYEFDSTLAPLHKRAWVVQERFLSPRTLYYGSSGIYWECRTSSAAEWDPEHIAADSDQREDSVRGRTGASLKSLYWQLQLALTSPERTRHFHALWYRIVEMYTETLLTFPKDRLIAIAGVVSVLAQRFGLSFCAGLWDNIPAVDLIWHMDISKARKSGYRWNLERNATKEIPSWSWASCPYPVEHPCQIFWTSSSNDDDMKHFELSGLVSIKAGGATSIGATDTPAAGTLEVTLSHPLFQCSVSPDARSVEMVTVPLRLEDGSYLCEYTPDVLRPEKGQELWCQLIMKQVSYCSVARYPWSHSFHGIALQADNEKSNTWFRVGYFHLQGNEKLQAIGAQMTRSSSDPIPSLKNIILV